MASVPTQDSVFIIDASAGQVSFTVAAKAAMRRGKQGVLATQIHVSVDRKTLVETPLAGTGYPEILDAVTACSRGEKGWWGEGAKKP